MVYSVFGLKISQTNIMLESMYICRKYSSNLHIINQLKKKPVVFKALKLPYVTNLKTEIPQRKKYITSHVERNISPNTNWRSIWPVAHTFKPDTVKIPLYMGYTEYGTVKYKRDCSIELLKLPNFLHLSPPAIKKHCAAIKQFCTRWPDALKSHSKCLQHFPLQIITSDYCFSSPSIREPLARIVKLKVRLGALDLDAHAKDKILRLVGDRYDPTTDIITIVTDQCPSKKQNLDYAKYLLTALYYESQNTAPWEAKKSQEDMELFIWDGSESNKTIVKRHFWPKKPKNESNYKTIPMAIEYKNAVSKLVNEGDTKDTLKLYKNSVMKLLGFSTFDRKRFV